MNGWDDVTYLIAPKEDAVKYELVKAQNSTATAPGKPAPKGKKGNKA